VPITDRGGVLRAGQDQTAIRGVFEIVDKVFVPFERGKQGSGLRIEDSHFVSVIGHNCDASAVWTEARALKSIFRQHS
jgi:hypothetical protein